MVYEEIKFGNLNDFSRLSKHSLKTITANNRLQQAPMFSNYKPNNGKEG